MGFNAAGRSLRRPDYTIPGNVCWEKVDIYRLQQIKRKKSY